MLFECTKKEIVNKTPIRQYDYDIRETLNESFGVGTFENIANSTNDLQILRLALEIFKNATDRLDNDLDNADIKQEYEKMREVENQIEEIIKEYV